MLFGLFTLTTNLLSPKYSSVSLMVIEPGITRVLRTFDYGMYLGNFILRFVLDPVPQLTAAVKECKPGKRGQSAISQGVTHK